MRARLILCWLCILAIALIAIPACSDDDEDNPTGTTLTFPAELIGEYLVTSASVNGTSQDLADFYEWDANAVEARIHLYSGGEQSYKEYDNNDSVVYADSGVMVFSAQNMMAILLTENGTPLAQPDTTFNGTWDFSGNILTLTMIDASDTIVLIDTKQ